MKIVHLVQYYMEGHTYQENYLPQAMARLGHDVTIVAGVDNPDFFSDTPHQPGDIVKEADNVRVRYVKMRYASLWTSVEGLYPLLAEERPDLVYVHGFLLTRCFALRRYMLRHKRCRFVCDTHETYRLAFNGCFSGSVKDRVRHFVYFRCVYRWWRRMVERHYEAVFYVTPPRKAYATAEFGFSESILHDLWLGADLSALPYERKAELRNEIRARHGLPGDAKLLLLAGKLDRLKRPVELAKAFMAIGDPGWYLVYVGSVPDDVRAEIEEAAGGTGRLVFTGFLPGEAVLSYITACDLAAYPGAHSVLWEQTVCSGIPAVFFEEAPHFGAYLSDDSARFVSKGDPDELCRVLAPLMADGALRQAMGERARRYGERALSYDMLAKKALDIAFTEAIPRSMR